jgi:hypothetical protein
MGLFLYMTWFFPLAAFDILSLFFIFNGLTVICFGEVLFLYGLLGVLKAFSSWMINYFPRFEKFSLIILLKMFSLPFFSLFFFFWQCWSLNSGLHNCKADALIA